MLRIDDWQENLSIYFTVESEGAHATININEEVTKGPTLMFFSFNTVTGEVYSTLLSIWKGLLHE
ncbi:hypothetical protein BPOR_0093g00180 [Botrytis porri]|uniref:Uncharacterized protein n=1 Tax=Botrytis porri TaxID=87229 RepID=A0A4Z1KZ48_9HELO|nr:hypothetical protein BPOR_0093g00180 [Botrytis porri]